MLGRAKADVKGEIVLEKEERPKVQRVRRRETKEAEPLSMGGSSFVFKGDLENPPEEKKFLLGGFPDEDEGELETEPVVVAPEPVASPLVIASEPEPVVVVPEPEPLEEQLDPWDRNKSESVSVNKSVIQKLNQAVTDYNTKNTGVYSDGVEIRYSDSTLAEMKVMGDGRMLLPNFRAYNRGVVTDWDDVNEVKIRKNQEFEVDTGVSFVLPDNYELEITGVDDLRVKYGLELIGRVVHVNRQSAIFPVVLQLRAVEDLAYVQRFKSVVRARLCPVSGGSIETKVCKRQ